MKTRELFLQYEKEVAEFKLGLIKKLSEAGASLSKERPKRTSNISMVATVLKAAGKPLHVAAIIAAVEKQFGVLLDRDSLSSALIKQGRKGKRFMRVAPNTFDLIQT